MLMQKKLNVGWLTDRQKGRRRKDISPLSRGNERMSGLPGNKDRVRDGKMSALCSGSLRMAELLTLTPLVSSCFSSPVCVVVVITPDSTCPSRCQDKQK